MAIRTSNFGSFELCQKIINGTYCKVIKSTSLLTISYTRFSYNAGQNGTTNNIIEFTNFDDTKCQLLLPTNFSQAIGTASWTTFNLSLNYKSFTFTSAYDPGLVP